MNNDASHCESDNSVLTTSQGSITFDQILEDPLTLIAIKKRNRRISVFIGNNINRLIEVAFYSNDTIIKNRAIQILLTKSFPIIEALSKSEILGDVIKKAFKKDDDKLSSFIGTLLSTMIQVQPSSPIFTDIIDELAQHCDNTSICYSLCELLKGKNGVDLSMRIYKKLISLGSENAYKALRICIPKIPDILRSAECIELCRLENCESWLFASELIDQSCSKYFQTQINHAVYLLSNLNAFLPIHEALFKFLRNALEIGCSFDFESMIQTCMHVFEEFPNHSIALRLVLQYLYSAFSDAFSNSLIRTKFIPFIRNLIDENGRKNITQYSFAEDFLDHISDLPMITGKKDTLDTELRLQSPPIHVIDPLIQGCELRLY